MNWLDVQLLIESMQKTMDCPICLEMMKNPVSTTCNHNFCNFCISKFIKSSRYVPCPMCKTPLSRRCFRENSKLQNIIDKVKKLVKAIETDTGWTYTTPTKHKTLPKSGKMQKSSSTSVKRKISLADNAGDLDDGENRNTRFGKRRKSTDDKDKDSHCNDSLSSEQSSLDVYDLSKELNTEPCLGDRQETVSCVAPPVIQKDKSIAKDDSLSEESKPKTQPSGNLRLTHVRSFDKGVKDNSDNSSILDEESQKSEFLDSHTKQTFPAETSNTNSLTLIPSTFFDGHNKENSRSEIISDHEECSAVEVSRAENLNGRYNFRRSSRCSADGSVTWNEPSGSVRGIQTQKEVLKNIKNLTKAFESPRKLDDQSVLESVNQNLPKNKNILASPVKTRNRIKCQQSLEDCVAPGQGLTKHSADNRFAHNKLKKEESILEVNASKSYISRKTLNTNIENVPERISTYSERNEHGLSQSTLDGGDYDNCLATGDDVKKTNSQTSSSCTFRNVEKDPFDQIANGPGNKNGQSLLIWSSDSEDDQIVVKKSDKEPSFKWSVESGKMKTYSRKHSSHKNRAKITKWLRLLPNNFDDTEDSTLNENGELSVPWVAFSLQDSESSNVDSKKKSKTDQKKEQISLLDCSIDSGPDLSVSQVENNTSVLGNEDKMKYQKIRTSMETDKDGSPRLSERIQKSNEMNLPLNTLKEKNLDSLQNDVEIDLRITSDKKDLKSTDIQECTLRIPDHFSLGNISMSGSSSVEKKSKNRFPESEVPADGNTLQENKNPFEFIDSPEIVKQQKCYKRQKTRKSLSKMPQLSFENRLTRSFQKRLSYKNLAPDVLPSFQGESNNEDIQEKPKKKISTGKKQLTKVQGNHGTQIPQENYSTRISQEKSTEHLDPVSLKLNKKETESKNLLNNAKQTFGSVPAQDNSASHRILENSLKCKKPDGILSDTCESSKEQLASGKDDSSLDGRNTDNRTSRTRKDSIEKLPDLKFVDPLASGNNRRKSGQRRRSRCSTKGDEKISVEQEILELANQINSAEEHSFLFNSQDVCRSFDVPVDDQVVSDGDTSWMKSNDVCNRLNIRPGESDNVTCSVTVVTQNENTSEDSTIQNEGKKLVSKDKTKDTNISNNIDYNCHHNEKTGTSLSMESFKNIGYKNSKFPATGTTENFSVHKSKPIQKTCSKPQQNKDTAAKDNFLKPAQKSTLRKNKIGNNLLKKDPQVLAPSSSLKSLEKNKFANAKTIKSISSTRNLVERKNFNSDNHLVDPLSLKDSQSKHLETKCSKDEFLKPAEKIILRKTELSISSFKKVPQLPVSLSSVTSLEKNELVNTKNLTTASSTRTLLQRKNIDPKASLEAPLSLTKDTILCQNVETVPSVAFPEEPISDPKVHTDKHRRNIADLKINTKKFESTNSKIETPVTIDGIKKMDPGTPSLFDEQLRNSPKSEQRLDQLSTPVMDPNDTDATNWSNAQKSVLPNYKNLQVCNISIPITPTVIPESPFSEVASTPGKDAMGTPALQCAEQKNRIIRLSNKTSFIYKLPNEVLKNSKGIETEISFPVEIVGSLQNSDSTDLQKNCQRLGKCDGDELKTEDSESKHLVINSKLRHFSDVSDMHSTLCKSHIERGTLTDSSSYLLQFPNNEKDLSVKVWKRKDGNAKKSEEFGKGAVRISPSAAAVLEPKPNLRYCGSNLSSHKDNAELSFENCARINSKLTESSSQRWMNEDLLPLGDDSANWNQDQSQIAAISEENSDNPETNGDRNLFTANQQPLTVKTGKEDPSLQDRDKRTQGLVTHEHVAHLPGNYHHLSDNYVHKDPSGINMEGGSNKKNDLIEVDEDSEGHSSGTEDLNVNPDPSEFEPPNLDIQPETVKKLLSDIGTTNLIKNVSPRFHGHSPELEKNSRIPANLHDSNMESSLETLGKSPVLTRSKTSINTNISIPSSDSHCFKNSSKKKSSVKKTVKSSSTSKPSNSEASILESENTLAIDQMSNSVSTASSSGHLSLKQNLESEDEKLCESLSSPCQILCYSSDDIGKDSAKTKELASMPEVHISKAANVEVLPNVRLVDYDISQSSLLSETDSDSVSSFTKLVGRRTRSSSRLQNGAKTCKSELDKAKSTTSNYLKNSRPDSGVYEECNKDILDPDKGSLTHAESLMTTTDNLDSAAILKLQDSSQSKTKTNKVIAEELILSKSGSAKKEKKNSAITRSDLKKSSLKAKLRNFNSSQNSNPAVSEECNKVSILDPDPEKESLTPITDNLDSVTILKSQRSQSQTNETVTEELVLPKSGTSKNEMKNSTVTKSDIKKSSLKAKLRNLNSSQNSDPAVYEESNKVGILDPDPEKESLTPTDSWITITDNLDSASILKSQDSSQSKTNEAVAEELVLPKSGITEKETKNSTITESENFTLSSAERKFLRSGFCETEEFSDTVEEKDQGAVVNRKKMDDINSEVAHADVSSTRKTEALTDCSLGDSDDLNSEKARKSASQNINCFVAPPLVQNSENVIDEDFQSENTLEPTQMSLSNPLQSPSQSDFVLENQDLVDVSKKQSVRPTEMVDCLKVDVPDTEIEDLPPVVSFSESVIPESLEPALGDQQELHDEDIPKLFASNQSASQNSLSGFVPCSVEQDGTLAHVLEPFREVYTQNWKMVSEKVCDGTNSQSNDIPENGEISKRSKIMADTVVKIPVPCQVTAESSMGDGTVHKFVGDGTVHKSDNIQDNPLGDCGDIIEKSPLFSVATSSVSNTSKIAFSTECHLMIDSQNFIPVKRSKRKCFSLAGSVQRSPQKANERNKTAVSCGLSAVTLNETDAECLDVKSAAKVLPLSPVVAEKSHQVIRNSLSDEAEKDVRNLSGTSSIQEIDLIESNTFESCVLISASEIGEFAQAATKDSCSVSHPKQMLPILEEESIEQLQSVSEEQKLDMVNNSSKNPNLTDNALTGLSLKSVNSSSIKESVDNQESLNSLISSSSANDAIRLRSSPRLRGRNKTVAKKQNEKKPLRRAKEELVSSKLQRKIPFKTSDSSKVDPEPLNLSPTGSDTQQPSCPLSSAEELEAESSVTCDPADNDNNTAPTQEPSLDFSEPDRIMDSPQRIPVKPMLEPDSDQHNPQEFLKNDENNLTHKESDKEDAAEGALELNSVEGGGLLDDSQGTTLSSASTKCPSGFSDSSVSAPSSQIVPSNLGDKDSSKNVRLKSRIRSGQKVPSQNARMEISERKVESSNDETKKVMEEKELGIKERSVDDGFSSTETNNPLVTELKNSQCQDKDDPIDDMNFLPDIQSSFPQGFYPEIEADDEDQNKTLVQLENPEEVSDITEISSTKKKSTDMHSECDSSEESSQEIPDKEQAMAKNQINNTDTKQADGDRSFTVNEEVIVIDELPSGLDCDGMPRTRKKSKDPVIIAPAEARQSTGQTVASVEDPVGKNLHDKGSTTAQQPSKGEDLESSEEFCLRRTKKPKYQVIDDDSDDDEKKVDIVNLESISASSPGALSTQSEKYSTQQCTHLEQDLEEMKKQIAQLEARLGLNDSAVDLVDEEGEEEDVKLQLPAPDEQNPPPDDDCKITGEATKEKACDPKYTRISSSSSDDDDDMCRKVIPDSDPDEKNIEPNVSTVFPVQKRAVSDLFSSGEESEDLFCTPGTSPSVPKLPVLNFPRQRLSRKGAEEEEEEEVPTDPPSNKNGGKRKRSSKDGTSKPSRLRIVSSSSSEDDMKVVIGESPKHKVISPKVKVKSKENKKARVTENKKRDNSRNLEEPPCISTRNSPRSAKNCPKTMLKLKAISQKESHSPILKELSFTNSAEATATTSQLCQPKKTKCFMATGLSNIEVNEIKRLVSMISGQFLIKFSREVTHVIVKTASENVRYCDRTLKYFQGIANKSWILSFKWIKDCLEKNRLLKEDPYEIIGDSVNGYAHRGPTRSRLSQVPLFKNFEIHVVGESSELPQDDLKSLFEMAGGNVVAEPEGFSSSSSITCLAIAGSNHSLKEFRRLKHQLKIYDILLVSREWILDSVAMYRVQPLEGYIQLS